MKMLPTIILVLFVLFPSSGHGRVKLERATELVFIIDESAAIEDEQFTHVVSVIQKVPDLVLMGPQAARVAVIVFSSNAKIEIARTAEPDLVKEFNPKRTSTSGELTNETLAVAKDVLHKPRRGATKNLVLILDGSAMAESEWEKEAKTTEAAAKDLTASGTRIFIAYYGDVNETIRGHLETVADHPSRVVNVDHTHIDLEETLVNFFEQMECPFEHDCKFMEPNGTNCKPVQWRAENHSKCSTVEPPRLKKCEWSQCEDRCNQWPWEQPNCSFREPRHVFDLKHIGPAPFHPITNIYENCRNETEYRCTVQIWTMPPPRSPITEEFEEESTTPQPTTEAEPSLTTESSVDDLEEGTSPVEHGIPSPDAAKSDTTRREHGDPSSEPSTLTMISSEKAAAGAADTNTEGSAGGMQSWMIGVIVCVLVALLLVIIVVAVLVTKKKNKQKREAADKLAMEKKLAAEKAAALKKEKSAGAPQDSGLTFGVPFTHGNAKVADECVGVSLRMEKTKTSARDPKSSASSVKVPAGTKAVASKSIMGKSETGKSAVGKGGTQSMMGKSGGNKSMVGKGAKSVPVSKK